MLKVKICGITNIKDALTAIEYGADALGFVFYPKSPRAITPEAAKSIISLLPPFITTAGVFVNENMAYLEKTASYTGLDIIQLHGSEPPGYCVAAKKIIKAIRVKDIADIEPLKLYKTVSAFLLDAYSPDAFGGAGKVFNWEIAVAAKNSGKIILAGGLTPDNIEKAVKTVQPYGVDVSTGVEGGKKGIKDHKKLRLFIERAKTQAQRHIVAKAQSDYKEQVQRRRGA